MSININFTTLVNIKFTLENVDTNITVLELKKKVEAVKPGF
jgi:hypothetical protein